ncbi:hypothetical protein GCM10010151_59870 [Actinoallomurus spadix]|uniref:Uncharacterized protein n=1 Tax=Actinoallomurus spadix TaxID=79912 RepID=A0ABN0XE66_9ACTN
MNVPPGRPEAEWRMALVANSPVIQAAFAANGASANNWLTNVRAVPTSSGVPPKRRSHRSIPGRLAATRPPNGRHLSARSTSDPTIIATHPFFRAVRDFCGRPPDNGVRGGREA